MRATSAVVLALAAVGFRLVPRTTLALLARLSVLLALALANNLLWLLLRPFGSTLGWTP